MQRDFIIRSSSRTAVWTAEGVSKYVRSTVLERAADVPARMPPMLRIAPR